MWTPERFPHVVQASKAAQLSTAFRFKERIKSKGGDTGEDALCSSCSDCRQRVKHVQAAATPPPAERVMRDGAAGGSRRYSEDMLSGVAI